jgi:hypothetical protein
MLGTVAFATSRWLLDLNQFLGEKARSGAVMVLGGSRRGGDRGAASLPRLNRSTEAPSRSVPKVGKGGRSCFCRRELALIRGERGTALVGSAVLGR